MKTKVKKSRKKNPNNQKQMPINFWNSRFNPHCGWELAKQGSLIASILFLLISPITQAQSFFKFNDNEELSLTVWTDPTFDDQGAQFGVEVTKELLWGWASVSVSHYEELSPSYTDLVASGGINFHAFNWDGMKVYIGPRLGGIYRAGNPFGLIGGVLGLQIKIDKNIAFGVRAWIDYREDQKDEFYGDSDGYKPGLITNNPLLQENGAITLTLYLE